MATRDQLQQRIREELGLPSTTTDVGNPKNSVILAVLGEVLNETWMRVAGVYPLVNSKTTTLSYTASSESVALGSTLRYHPIISVEAQWPSGSDSKDRYALVPHTPEELLQMDLYGSPEYYAINHVAALIHLRPMPETTTTLTVRYIPSAAALSGGSSAPTELPSDFHHVLVTGTVARLLRRMGDENWRDWRDEYEDQVFELQKYMGRVHNDKHLQSRSIRRI